MLAPQDLSTNDTTSECGNNTLVHSPSIPRAPQDPNYQISDSSHSSALVASPPQYIDGYSVLPTHIADSQCRTPAVRQSHAKFGEYSPSVSHSNTYSSPLASPRVSSSYIPPLSPPLRQSNAYPVPGAHYGKIEYSDADDSNNQHQQLTYQDLRHQSYQQPYPEPTLHVYPEPALADTFDEKVGQASAVKPVIGRRKRLIWIGAAVILVLVSVIVGLVIAMRNNDSGSGSNDSNSANSSSGTSTAPRSTPTTGRTSIPVRPPTSSIPVIVPTSSIPVIVPTPIPSSGGGGGGGGGNGGRVTPPPLPPLPAPGQCPFTFCGDYFSGCQKVCNQDSEYKESYSSDNMSEDDSDKDFKRISKELSRYVFELRQMLEDDLRTYVKAANAQEREVLQKLMDIVGRYFNDLNGTIRALLLAITESMVIFEEGCIHLFEDEIEMLDMHHKGLQDVIGRCDMANEELVTLFAEIGVQVSEYEKEKSKFEIVKPDGISCSVIGTLSTGAGVIFQLASKSNPMTAVASVAVLLVGGLVLQYAQNKINDIEYFVKRLVLIHNIGRGIRDELLEVSKILGRLKENIAMLSRTAQAGQSKIKTIEFKAKRVSQLCNEMYAFKSRVMPKFMPLLVAYSEQNSDKEHTLVARTRSITQKDA